MFTLTLVTPEKRLVNKLEIEEVSLPGFRGELDILPGHAPLMTTLATGVLKYRLKGDSKFSFVAVNGGYAQVNPAGVNVLAETAERSNEIDVERLTVSEKEAERRLQSEDLEPAEIVKLQAKVLRARVRREVASLTGGPGH